MPLLPCSQAPFEAVSKDTEKLHPYFLDQDSTKLSLKKPARAKRVPNRLAAVTLDVVLRTMVMPVLHWNSFPSPVVFQKPCCLFPLEIPSLLLKGPGL